MKINEAAVFKWVVIVGIAAVFGDRLDVADAPSWWGALWGLVLAIAGCVLSVSAGSRRKRREPRHA